MNCIIFAQTIHVKPFLKRNLTAQTAYFSFLLIAPVKYLKNQTALDPCSPLHRFYLIKAQFPAFFYDFYDILSVIRYIIVIIQCDLCDCSSVFFTSM